MNLNSFFVISTSSDHIIEGVKKFVEGSEFSPIVWTCGPEDIQKVEKIFPGVVCFNVFDLICGDLSLFASKIGLQNISFEIYAPDFQSDFSAEKFFVLENLLHRSDPGNCYSHYEIREIINRYFLFAFNLLMLYKPKFIFYEVPPHTIYDLAIYLAAQKLGFINVVMLYSTIPCLAFFTNNFLRPRPFIKVKENEQFLVDAKRESFHKAISAMSEYVPFYMDKIKYSRNLFLMIRQSRGIIVNTLREMFRQKSIIRSKYEKKKGYFLDEKQGSPFSIARQFFLYCRLELKYKKISERKLPIAKPFVYVPLSYQHEMSTMPYAGPMYDQLCYIRVLASELPSGWSIIVKENPKQFSHLNGIPNRNHFFYQELVKLGVYFAPLDMPSHELIEKSCLVAVTTGSAGFEGLIGHGKPVLAFSFSWYSHLHGITLIRNRRDLLEFFKKFLSGKILIDKELLKQELEELVGDGFYCHPTGETVDKMGWNSSAMSENIRMVLRTVSLQASGL